MTDYEEFTVRIKDKEQNIIHRVKQLATSQREANTIVLEFLIKSFGHFEFEVL